MFWIGLYLDGAMTKWAKLSRHNKKISIELLRTLPISETNTSSFLQSSVEQNSCHLVSGLDSSEILLRTLQLKLQDRKKILKLLPFQIEPNLPCSHEEAIVSAQITPGETPKSSKISYYVTKKSSLQSHIDFLKSNETDPDQVSCVPAALCRFSKHFFPHLTNLLVLHIGSKTSTLLGIWNKKPCFSHSFPLGTDVFSSTTEETDTSVLEQKIDQVKKELDRVFSFVLKKHKESWQDILLTGNFSVFPPLKRLIIESLPDSIQLNECRADSSYDATTIEAYAIPIGLAIDGLCADEESTEFRQENFLSSSQRKHRIKLFSSFALSSLILTVATYVMSHIFLDYTKNSLISNCQTSFFLQDKPIDSLEDLDQELFTLESSLKKDKTPYPLNLPLPNVSEVLAWISCHPILNSSSSTDEANEADMKKIKYQLVKHPKISNPKDPYVAKVELEIEIPNPQIAKDFQEALHKDRSFIDLKKEISWQAKGSTYLISFFLKNSLEGDRS